MEDSNYLRVQLRKCAGRYMEMAKWYGNGTDQCHFQKSQIRNPLVLLLWQGSSVGESAGFITPRSAVQICLLLPAVARD